MGARAYAFIKKVHSFARKHRRDFSWREKINPYRIVVSEIMLQQTQTMRVQERFPKFITAFPNFAKLAQARTDEVLRMWQGMGYNRRALQLRKLATLVEEQYGGNLPKDQQRLVTLPGIGPATAGAICAFAFNLPGPFIETNIRRVYLHHFFKNKKNISDKEILALVERTMDKKNPREWFYALEDYGAWLGKNEKENPNRRSRHYHQQKKFAGSHRQIRGLILRELLQNSRTEKELSKRLKKSNTKIQRAVEELCAEGFLKKIGEKLKVLP